MKTHHLFAISIVALGVFGLAGCAAGIGDESDEDVASAEQALGLSCGYLECVDEGDPYFPYEPGGGGEPSCGECGYISWKRGYFYVCSNGPGFPVSYHECEP